MLAVAGNVLSDMTLLYFALSQSPVYLSPHFLEPIVKRIKRADPTGMLERRPSRPLRRNPRMLY